jgi:hypothetical protein
MFKTANTLEVKGITIEYGEGVEIQIARAGGANKKFAKALTRLTRPHRTAIKNDVMDEGLADDLILRAYAETVILGWDGVTREVLTGNEADTEPLECTVENVIAVMTELPDLFKDIQRVSQDLSAFRADVLESDSKN